eukprot:3555923-Amphidinium_carterae.1
MFVRCHGIQALLESQSLGIDELKAALDNARAGRCDLDLLNQALAALYVPCSTRMLCCCPLHAWRVLDCGGLQQTSALRVRARREHGQNCFCSRGQLVLKGSLLYKHMRGT